MTVSPLLISGWREVLELSRLTADEVVVQLLGPESAPAHVEASRLAVASLGARLVTVALGEGQPKMGGNSTAYYGPTALNGNRAAIAARTGPVWACTTSARAMDWNRAPSPAISCSPPVPMRRRAARGIPRAISIFR